MITVEFLVTSLIVTLIPGTGVVFTVPPGWPRAAEPATPSLAVNCGRRLP
jgi:hypothetical protein